MTDTGETDEATPRPGDFTGEWHPVMLRRMVTLGRPLYKFWFRSEVRGLDSFPGRWSADRVEPFRRDDSAGRARAVARLFREVRLRPPAVHAGSRPPVPGADHKNPDADGHDSRHPRQRQEGVALRRGGHRFPRRRQRGAAAHMAAEQDRLQRPDRLCHDGHRGRRTDRARGVDRRAGNPVVPDPRRMAGKAAGAETPDARQSKWPSRSASRSG